MWRLIRNIQVVTIQRFAVQEPDANQKFVLLEIKDLLRFSCARVDILCGVSNARSYADFKDLNDPLQDGLGDRHRNERALPRELDRICDLRVAK